ncbi:MAG: hypothetical protein WBV46_17490, partial [Terriglobales bacterium]
MKILTLAVATVVLGSGPAVCGAQLQLGATASAASKPAQESSTETSSVQKASDQKGTSMTKH